MKSNTPRVDAAAERGSDLGPANTWISGIWPLARELEIELAKVTEQRDRLISAAKVYCFNYLQDERDDVDLCPCGDKQHSRLNHLFDLIREIEESK